MAHPDLDELLNFLLPPAQQMLSENGEFFPFGASMSRSGEVHLVGGYTAEEQPSPPQMVDLLIGGFREKAGIGVIRASGVCVNVRTVPPHERTTVDAICVRLEHEGGEALQVFLPYSIQEPGSLEYGDLFAAPGENAVFATPP